MVEGLTRSKFGDTLLAMDSDERKALAGSIIYGILSGLCVTIAATYPILRHVVVLPAAVFALLCTALIIEFIVIRFNNIAIRTKHK